MYEMSTEALADTAERLKIESTSGIVDLPGAREHIRRFIEFYGERDTACPLNDLNRRYGRILKKLGSSIKDEVIALAQAGQVIIMAPKATWVLSPRFKTALEETALEYPEISEYNRKDRLSKFWILQGEKTFLGKE